MNTEDEKKSPSTRGGSRHASLPQLGADRSRGAGRSSEGLEAHRQVQPSGGNDMGRMELTILLTGILAGPANAHWQYTKGE